MAANKNNNDSQNSQSNLTAQQAQIGAIRDIIFGQNMQDYESRFNDLSQNLNQSNDELKEALEAQNRALLSKIEKVEASLGKLIESNKEQMLSKLSKLDEQKMDRKKLGKMLIDIGTKMSA